MLPLHRQAISVSKRVALTATAAAALLLATGCAQEVQTPEASLSGALAAPMGSTSEQQSLGAAEELSSGTSKLRYVSTTASPCSMVWTAGTVLPLHYEWCLDETGQSVAGVRIGSCEVISFRGQMYAVPGRRIMVGTGTLYSDPQFVDALTSCKRRPASKN